MKIDEQRPVGLDGIGDAYAAIKNRAAAERPATAGDDTVALSPGARRLTELRSLIGDPSEIDQERVASLRAALADGSFQPSSDAIASSLLSEVAADSIA